MKQSKKIYILTLALIATIIFSCGNEQEELTTGVINGLITDSAGAPISSAIITTISETEEVFTNDTGFYEIPGVEPGEYTVRAEKATYIPKSVNITVEAGAITTANISIIQSPRNVLGEMLTTTCHCSDDARAAIYAVKDNCGSRFIHLEYHASSDPLLEEWDPFVTEESEKRRLYYADTFEIGAMMFFDGANLATSTSSYQQIADSLLQIYSPLTILINGTYSSTTGSGHLDVEITAKDTIKYNDLVVEFAIYEKGPVDFEPADSCIVPFRYILVNLETHEQLNISLDEKVNLSKDFTVPETIGGKVPPFHTVNRDNIGVAVFVQSRGAKEILQAAFRNF